jgi:hypothetical protein
MLEAHRIARPGRRTDAMRGTMEAGIAMLEGRPSDARRLYADALGRWQDLGLPTWLALCQLDIIETGALEPAERRRAADEARGFLERVGARPFIERLDAALAREPAATGSLGTRTSVAESAEQRVG